MQRENTFDRADLPYDAMGDFSFYFKESKEKEEQTEEEPDCSETDMRLD